MSRGTRTVSRKRLFKSTEKENSRKIKFCSHAGGTDGSVQGSKYEQITNSFEL